MNRKTQQNPAVGRRVVSMDTNLRRLAPDFPGWGQPNVDDFLIETPAGIMGTIVDVEHHGMNPWTRYTVKFDDNTRSAGCIIGKDIKLA